MNKDKIWSTTEKELLIDLIDKSKTVKEINLIMSNRSINAIQSKMCQLNIYVKSRDNPRWTKEEIETLINLYESNKTIKEISLIINRSLSSISSKLRKFNKQNPKPVWSISDDDKLKKLITIEPDVRKIAKELNRTYSAVSHRMAKLGLSTQRGKNRLKSIDFINFSSDRMLADILNKKFTRIKLGSEKRNINFSLRREDLFNLYQEQNGKCFYTGMEMKLKSYKKDNHYILSVDRIDSNKGYEKDNIVLCCYIVNVMKSNLEISEFYNICKKIISKTSSKQYNDFDSPMDN